MFVAAQCLFAQSADSRVCKCFASTVSPDFLMSSKAFYGSVGIALRRDLELKPKQGDPVKFILPTPPVINRNGCATTFMIYIADAAGNKVFEQSSASNELSYIFSQCNRTYAVTLSTTSRSTGADGNCTRRINFKVTPQCATVAVCNCFTEKNAKEAKVAISADLGLNGSVQPLGYASGTRRYAIRFDIINKSDCVLNIQSVTVHGQTIEVPPHNTAPRSQTKGVSLGFSTPYAQSAPADTKVSVVIRYSMNGQKCVATTELPYLKN